MNPTQQIHSLTAVAVMNICLVLPSAHAANRTWSGAGTDAYWNDAANWGGTAPVNADNLLFSGTTQQNNNNNITSLTVGWMQFANGGFTLNGNLLTLSPAGLGMFTNLAGVNTIAANLYVPASKFWSIAAGSELRITGTITNPAAAGTSIGWMLLTNGGTVRIMNSAKSQRGADLWQGTLIFDGSSCLFDAFSDGIRFRPPAGATATVILTNNATVRVGGGGNYRMGNSQTSGGGTPAAAGSTSVTTISSGTLELYGAATTIYVSDNIASLTAIFNQNGGLVWGSAGSGNTITFGNATSPTGIYNLNGGTLWIGQIKQANSGANAFNFNGGILKPTVSTTAFMQGVDATYVQSGGAIIDTTNLTISIAQNLLAGSPSGGLTKLGTGTLALTGSETYTGSTVVSNGTLAVNTGTLTGGGAVQVADAATLSVTNAGGSTSVSSLTLGAAGTNTLQFVFPSGNAGSASIVAGSLTGNGHVTINIAGSGLAAGTVPLINFTTGTGLANFHLGSVPPGMTANLVASGSSLQLNIVSVGKNLEWSGAASANWDTSSINWYDLANGNNPTNYAQGASYGDIVTFDDNLSANPAITLLQAVLPVSITVNNNSAAYSFTGAGKISGVATLTKTGFQALTLGTANDFSGGISVTEGALYAGANLALGTGPTTLTTLATLASDGTTARTLSNSIVQIADTGVILGDTANTGTLTLGGTLDLAGGTTRTLDFNSDVLVSGSLTNGAFTTKTGPGNLIVTGNSYNYGLATQGQGDVIVNGGWLTCYDGWRVASTTAGATLRLVVTNGGVLNVAISNNTGNIRVGYTGGDGGSTGILDISGTVNLNPGATVTAGVNGNNAVTLGMSGVNDYLYLRAGGKLITRSLFGSSPGNAEADFMGGTLVAIANDTGFITGLTNAFLQDGGLTIDTTNFSVTVPQPLLAAGNGGLTKLGAGTLTLTGANTYSGPTVINAGKLVLGPAHASPGAITVNAGATLAFLQSAAPATVNVPSVTIGGGANSALELQLSVTNAPAAIITNLILNGSVAVNVSGSFGAGELPLFGFGTISGPGNLTLGTVPLGTVAHLVTNVPNHTIDLLVTSIAALTWTGASSGNWDTVTTNWTALGTPVAFGPLANVVFNDSATTPSVSLTTNLTPSTMVVSNNALIYAFSGSGSLGGNMTLVKDGTNSATLSTANTYTGATTVKAGTLVAGNATAFGDVSATITVQSGATLDINGNTIGSASLQPVVVSGGGVGGAGAIVNSGALQNNALRAVTFTGNTTLGGAGSIGLRTTANTDPGLIANGFKLTKVGSGQFNLNGGTTTAGITNTWFLDIGNVDIQQGILSFQRHSGLGNPTNTVTVESGATLLLYSLTPTNPVPPNHIVMTNGILQGTGATVGDTNALGGTITLYGATNAINTTFSTFLVLNGPLVGPGGVIFSATNVLAGTNTYTGNTVISNGVLTLAAGAGLTGSPSITTTTNGVLDVSALSLWTLGAGQTLGGSGTVIGSVLANGTLAPGSGTGTLTVNGNLTLAGNVRIAINKSLAQSNDLAAVSGSLNNTGSGSVVVTNLGPALAVGDKFTLFSEPVANGNALAVTGAGATWTNNLAVDGSISVLTVAPVGPTHAEPITFTSTGGNLNLSWPTIGWQLQAQTNSLATGLNTNWVTWPGSTTTNAETIPAGAGNPSVFFRLFYP